MAAQEKDLTKGREVQIRNEIRIEYDFAVPTYTVKSLGLQQELPPFQETCEIFKNDISRIIPAISIFSILRSSSLL